MTETLYFFRALDSKRTEIAKFVDGSKSPQDVYLIVGTQCNCHGAWTHKVECKHLKMLKWWESIGKPPAIALDYDKNLFYRLTELT